MGRVCVVETPKRGPWEASWLSPQMSAGVLWGWFQLHRGWPRRGAETAGGSVVLIQPSPETSVSSLDTSRGQTRPHNCHRKIGERISVMPDASFILGTI